MLSVKLAVAEDTTVAVAGLQLTKSVKVAAAAAENMVTAVELGLVEPQLHYRHLFYQEEEHLASAANA